MSPEDPFLSSSAHNIDASPRDYSLYDNLLSPVAVFENGVVVYFNQTFAQFLQLPPRKIRGKTMAEVLSNPSLEQHLAQATTGGQPVVTPEIEIGAGENKKEVVLKFFPLLAPAVALTIQDFSIERILHAKHRIQLDELKAKNAEIKKYSEGLEILVEERTQELRVAMDQSERLLLNILPKKIAERLKANEGTIADRFDAVSVLFLDIVSFTPITSGMDPIHVIEFLSRIFDAFDSLMDKHGIEKIKTIGDCYLAVAGAPVASPSHAVDICSVALAMMDEIRAISKTLDFELNVRLGIHSGPVVAGVIGHRKFAYDIWGDTVNVASRMESHGEKNRIQISASTYELIKDRFECQERGIIDVKGKGQVKAYWLLGRK